MTFGTLAGMMACDGVLDRRNPWTDLFDVDRKKIGSAWNYIKENADYPYYLIRDRFAGTEAARCAASIAAMAKSSNTRDKALRHTGARPVPSP